MTKNLLIIGFVAGVIAIGLFFGISQYQTNIVTLYHVYADGEKIGTVDNKAIIDIWVSQELRKAEELYGSAAFEIKNNITFKKEIVYKGSFNNLETIDALKNKVEIQAKGIELFINGKSVGVVGDQAAADRLINNIKQEYLPQSEKTKISAASLDEDIKQEVTLESIKISEDIQMRERIVSPEEIISEENMFDLLIQGTTVSTPLVTVQTKELTTLIETIPYSVVYQKDNTMFINETKTIKAGEEGSKEVEYSTVKENGKVIEKTKIAEKVIEEPTDEIVIKGTKIPVSGTGNFIWPTSGGIITSDYGARWGTTHDGLDIAYPVDYTIKAAADGTVIFAGWMDGYGNTLLIDHGNGLETLYAHLSSFSVTKGGKVAKGEKIGVMGNTGRSTGTHLHFEVRVHGEPRNPLNYVEI